MKLLRRYAIAAFVLLNGGVLSADSSGPNSPATVVGDTSIGSTAWSSTGNVTASDDSRARANGASIVTHYIKATNFSFSIPSGATIDGIVVEAEVSELFGDMYDNAVRIVKGGAIGSTDKASGTAWTGTDTYLSHGGASDLWGETWTDSDINSSNFGMAISAKNNAPVVGTANVDHVRITVYYTTSGGGGSLFQRRRIMVTE